jgi:hypothetical protein
VELPPVGSFTKMYQAVAVAQVDEDEPAVVAAAVDPPAEGDGLARVSATEAAGCDDDRLNAGCGEGRCAFPDKQGISFFAA